MSMTWSTGGRPAEYRCCMTCRCFRPDSSGPGGQCRHDPPRAGWGWPVCGSDDWCCKWERPEPMHPSDFPYRFTTAGGSYTVPSGTTVTAGTTYTYRGRDGG